MPKRIAVTDEPTEIAEIRRAVLKHGRSRDTHVTPRVGDYRPYDIHEPDYLRALEYIDALKQALLNHGITEVDAPEYHDWTDIPD